MTDYELPMMPLWVDPWLKATPHWDSAERGAYLSLLVFQWRNGHVPREVAQLARITGTSELEFERLWQTIGGMFDEQGDGLLNLPLEEDRERALQRRAAFVERGHAMVEKVREKRAKVARKTIASLSQKAVRIDLRRKRKSRVPLSKEDELSTDEKSLWITSSSPSLESSSSPLREDSSESSEFSAENSSDSSESFKKERAHSSESAAADSSESGRLKFRVKRKKKEKEKTDKKKKKKQPANALRARRVPRGARRLRDFYDEQFLRFKLAMPNRAGGHDWVGARRAWNGRLQDGYPEQLMIAGAERYAKYADAMIADKDEVMQASKFLGLGSWFLQDWEVHPDLSVRTPPEVTR
jgi:uncharacterized protein YdaU (DUF1376 family)